MYIHDATHLLTLLMLLMLLTLLLNLCYSRYSRYSPEYSTLLLTLLTRSTYINLHNLQYTHTHTYTHTLCICVCARVCSLRRKFSTNPTNKYGRIPAKDCPPCRCPQEKLKENR